MAASAEELIYGAIASVRGAEKNRAMAALTLDHLLYEQIQRIEGGDPNFITSVESRPVSQRTPKLEQLDAIKRSIDDLVSAVEQAGDDPAALHALGLLTKKERQAIEDGEQP